VAEVLEATDAIAEILRSRIYPQNKAIFYPAE
jgi:hypothetical protein